MLIDDRLDSGVVQVYIHPQSHPSALGALTRKAPRAMQLLLMAKAGEKCNHPLIFDLKLPRIGSEWHSIQSAGSIPNGTLQWDLLEVRQSDFGV